VDLDRQAIERRDFPISRRGYDTVAVDAHLQALAAEFEELQRTAIGGGADVSLAATAGSQVQIIIEAAETAAAEIERQALENARRVREDADRDAERTREEAIERARAHVAAVAQVATTLLERVGSMDGEVGTLMDSLRAGAGRLASDLTAVESSMAELYDAASGSGEAPVAPEPARGSFQSEFEDALAAVPPPQAPPPARAPPPSRQPPVEPEPASEASSEDIDGARLIALNMALNGESRADTERYLAENFQLGDRLKLIDEVYAAIEG
jgi:hypothetical protein